MMQTVISFSGDGAGEAADDEDGRERHELRDQQRQQKSGGIEPQGRAVGRRHVDDRVDAVDVEEEGEDEEQDLRSLRHIF